VTPAKADISPASVTKTLTRMNDSNHRLPW
jgi:hypothetical protein